MKMNESDLEAKDRIINRLQTELNQMKDNYNELKEDRDDYYRAYNECKDMLSNEKKYNERLLAIIENLSKGKI